MKCNYAKFLVIILAIHTFYCSNFSMKSAKSSNSLMSLMNNYLKDMKNNNYSEKKPACITINLL